MVTSILAIGVHYIVEFGKDMGDYNCPSYCKVKHKHITQEVMNGRNDDNNNAEREENKHLYGIKWDDKHTISK